jgi:hypothetical protein
MMHRVNQSNAIASELQNAAELRRNQAASAQATQKSGAQYNFAEIFGGSNWGQTEEAAAPSSSTIVSAPGGFHSAIATATAMMLGTSAGARLPVTTPSPTSATTTETATETASTNTASTATGASSTTAAATAETAATTTPAAVAVTTPGVEALVTAIMNGSFQPTYESSPSQLQEITPAGTDYMPGFYYASNQTAQQMAQLLGGTVVQSPAFGQDKGWSEPNANFIQLPSGQMFNAADVAYYAKSGSQGAAQLTADITATINQGSAWTNYYQQGGSMPTFAMGYVGPPIGGSTYPSGMIGADGNVINPAMQQTSVKGT